MGNQLIRMVMYQGLSSSGFAWMSTLCSRRIRIRSESLGIKVLKAFPSM